MEKSKLWGRRVVFSESLLLQARKSPNLVRGIERHLNAFVLEATAKVRAPACALCDGGVPALSQAYYCQQLPYVT